LKIQKSFQKNLKMFLDGKSNDAQVFDKLTTTKLNAHLQSLMKGLTAKVFRTYNASETMQQELAKWDSKQNDLSPEEKLAFFTKASIQVAVLCNHQRTLSKSHAVQMENLDTKINEATEEIKQLTEHLQLIKEGKTPTERKNKNGEPLKPFSMNSDVVSRRIATLQKKIKTSEYKKIEKEDTKEIATSTSKVSYIDPRISLAWCVKAEMDFRKIFAQALEDKFAWAIFEIKTKPDFQF